MSPSSSSSSLRPLSVLLVDGSAKDRGRLRELLQQAPLPDCEVFEVRRGADALQVLGASTEGYPDFLLLADPLPDMPTLQFLQQVGDARGLPPCPTLVLIGPDADATQSGRAALQAGAQDYLGKDWLNPALLLRALDNAAERWRNAQPLGNPRQDLRRKAERESYLLALTEQTRALREPQQIKQVAAALLGRSLGASRVLFLEAQADGRFRIEGGYCSGLPPLDGLHALSDFGAELQQRLLRGDTVRSADVRNDPDCSVAQRERFAALGVQAHISASLAADDADDADCMLLLVHQDRPRRWTTSDIELVGETLSRTLLGITVARAQALLRENERHLTELIELMPSFNAVLRGPQLLVERVNEPCRELIGRGPEIVGQSLHALMTEPDEQAFLALLERTYRSGLPFRALGLPLWRPRPADGGREQRFVDLACIPLRDLQDRVNGVLLHGLDRSDQVLAEQALAASRRGLQAMADNLPVIVARFDRGLRRMFVNLAAQEFGGLSQEEASGEGRHAFDLLPGPAAELDISLQAALDSGQTQTYEFQLPGPSGPREFRGRLVPELNAESKADSVLAVIQEVTEERRAERAVQATGQQKDLFLATLAHELRNPMAPLRSGLEILRRQSLPEPCDSVVAMMERQLSHLVNLVDDLLDLTRFNLGKITLRRRPVDVAEAIAAAVEACRPQLDARQHRLRLPQPAEALWVDADFTRLVQILVNLLSNAIKYSEPGGEIDICTRQEAGFGCICVRDRGVGIAAAALPFIWGMFSQVEGTLDKADGGLGLGLWLTRRLAELHGGSVEASSAGVGEGSLFVVRLPLAGQTAPAEEAVSHGSGRLLPRPGRILIVDDSPDNAASLATLLRSQQHEVYVAHGGAEALQRVTELRPSLLLLDIGLPDMDGYELARRVRAQVTAGQAPLLVALTGLGSDEHRQKSRHAGFDLHLTKPVQLARIEALFETRAAD